MGKVLKGIFKSISVSEGSIVISNNIGHGSTEFPLSEVTNFIFQKGSFTKNGFLTICTLDGAGYNVTVNTAATNKNSVMFQYTKNNEFELLYLELIEMVGLKNLEDLRPSPIDTLNLNSEQEACIDNEVYEPAGAHIGSGHPVKICSNCGEILLEQAQRCPKCGEKGEKLLVIDSDDSYQIQSIRAAANHENKKGFWQRTIEEGREINRQKEAVKATQPKPLSKKERIKENKANAVACCPKCGSASLSANKKGFGVGKAAVGVFAVGVLGAAAGGIGSGKVVVTCLNCGHRWKV